MQPSKQRENQSTENNKRIAKNTLLLYFRMLLTLLVSLFTVRVVLNTLGVTDYGIFNVVGGIVYMFSFLSGTMASASQRFFAFELGRNNIPQLKKTFSLSVTIYVILAIFIFILAETVGLWFLNNKMTIPENRMVAARWVYQFSILSFMITMFSIPYHAAIIAHEKMKVYAYVSILEVTLKLIIVYLLTLFNYDKLKLYAILIFAVTTLVTIVYRTYCIRNFEESKYFFFWEKKLFRELVEYSGWNLLGASAGIFKSHGINILLNVFFSPIVNAARAIAFQVNNAIDLFVGNFFTAVSPQITKYYAAGEKKEMIILVLQSSKLSYFLLFILSMPIMMEPNFIFTLWLKTVPEYTVLFTRLVIINTLIDSLSRPLIASALATGKIKQYQIVVGGTMLLNLPLSYFFLKLGYPPQMTMYIAIAIAIINLCLRLWMLNKMINLSIENFIRQVLVKIFYVSLVASVIPLFLYFQFEEGLLRFIIILIMGMFFSIGSIYFLGISSQERRFLRHVIQIKILSKFRK